MRRVLLALCAVLLTACSHHLSVPRIGMERDVVTGGQAQIDAGLVVDVDGLPGIWIAGHRTTHGGTFRRVIELHAGDEVAYMGVHYIVRYTTVVPFDWPPHYLGTLVLQTSNPTGGAFLAVCEPG
jgi:sortase (surface protein transpeptidase)